MADKFVITEAQLETLREIAKTLVEQLSTGDDELANARIQLEQIVATVEVSPLADDEQDDPIEQEDE